ncbi:hypothetical protein EDB87DRAFT_1171026 [Lactarius vividus]|nr:hypothetical protein EDB87DRAFT_1171026 [Lactarius vividus]
MSYGALRAGKPPEAGSELHGGERLTLLETVRPHLPTVAFAFLSARHTARVTEESIVDGALHLAAVVQYYGFRSVVGMKMDGTRRNIFTGRRSPLLDENRGHRITKDRRKALRFAVKKLRKEKKEEMDHPREMGEFRSLWCMIGGHLLVFGCFEHSSRA